MGRIRLLELTGSYYEMGFQHGQTFAEAIRMFAEDRVHLSSDPHWTGKTLGKTAVLELAEACVAAHQAYSPQLMEEVQGMADATGLSLAELVIVNGFTDFIDTVYAAPAPQHTPVRVEDNCTAFLIPPGTTADGHSLYGQTWDMHATATPYIVLLKGKPADAPAFITFTITGCVGMVGLNSAGIAIGINNLLGGDGQVGVTWPFVVRKALQQTTLEAALQCITEAPLAGAHNYLIMDKAGRGYNIEAMSTRHHITPLAADPLVHTNHCLINSNQQVERERPADSLASSQNRLRRADDLLSQRPITPEMLMALTRDSEAICVKSKPPMHVETCGGAIMRPATGEFWAVQGLPSENEYERFVL